MRIYFEPRLQESKGRSLIVPVAAIVLAGLTIGSVLLAIGVSPLVVYREIIVTSFTSEYGPGDTLARATPLILTSLATAFAFKMKVLSVGAEGQLVLGAIAAASAAILLDGKPAVVLLPLTLIAGALGGALWALGPGLLAAYLGVNIVITTLLLNFVAILFAKYLIFGSNSFLTENLSNFPQGRQINENAWLPHIGNQTVTWGLAVSLSAALIVYLIWTYTRFGYNVRVLGDSPKAAAYAGIGVSAMVLLVLLGVGGLAGLAGAVEVSGRTHALDPAGLAIGIGYTGIIIAVLARLNPFGIVLVSVLFGGLLNSGSALQGLGANRVPDELVSVMIATVLIFALMGEVFVRYHIKIVAPKEIPAESARGVTSAH